MAWKPPRNLPNAITISRLVLAACLFVILGIVTAAQQSAGSPEQSEWLRDVLSRERLLFGISTVIFVLAAFSDMLDGYVARRWNLQTDFGRIVDPFADKVTICGAFVFLISLKGSPIAGWMVVVILARELLVDGLRGFAESRGVAFPSQWAGKVKMFVQSVCIGWALTTMAAFPGESWALWVGVALALTTIASTLYSGGIYVFHARRVLGADQISAPATGMTPAPAPAPTTPAVTTETTPAQGDPA
ncbi:MAG: CDP-diacylglycerol--glycerol-3-phosphate 3-phosphatidyltransferase [Planctomycetes bacterium]|nr:CDP-diacylglycerol--glycerol-3-phosphate 3-phosphatidyltransferase [Planctomycetota bacterium]